MASSSSCQSSSSSSSSMSSPRRSDEKVASSKNADNDSDIDYSSLTFLGPTSSAIRAGVWRRIGVLGGGQLGRMLAEEARLLNVQIVVLDPTKNCPASQVGAEHILGDFRDPAAIETLASRVDVLMVEIEHVDTEALEAAALKYNIPVHPSPRTLRIIQDKYLQKEHLRKHTIPTADYIDTPNAGAIAAAAEKFGLPLMLKSRTLAYDGRGNYLLKSADRDSIHHAIAVLTSATKNNKSGEDSLPLYAESFQEFDRELAVMVVKSQKGGCAAYPAVQTIHVDSICHTCIAPAQIDGSIRREAEIIALQAVATFEGVGVFGVELFLLKNGKILLNEIAPRPHNSGHYSIEACNVSQFGNHLRVLLGLPIGAPTMRVPVSMMVNVLGTGNNPDIDIPLSWIPCEAALHVPGASVHWYGKSGVSLKRKVGHITFVGDSIAHIEARIQRWQKTAEALKAKFRQQIGSNDNSNTVVVATTTTDSTAEKKENNSTSSAVEKKADSQLTPSYPESSPIISPWLGLQFALSSRSPLVGVIMGSDSDLPTMKPALNILKEFSIPFEVSIVSAHRTPDRLMRYAKAAAGRGIKTIIAAAGGAAHLPGMVAAITPLPVVGVPVPLTYLDGQDSLYSIVQMPRGIPVATVAIGNSTNGALLAVRILSVHYPSLLISMQHYLDRMESEVYQKVDLLNQQGWENYTPKHK